MAVQGDQLLISVVAVVGFRVFGGTLAGVVRGDPRPPSTPPTPTRFCPSFYPPPERCCSLTPHPPDQTANAGALVPVARNAHRAPAQSEQAHRAVYHGPPHAGQWLPVDFHVHLWLGGDRALQVLFSPCRVLGVPWLAAWAERSPGFILAVEGSCSDAVHAV